MATTRTSTRSTSTRRAATTKRPRRGGSGRVVAEAFRFAARPGVVGVGLLVVAALAALAIYLDTGGPVGTGLELTLAAAMGVLRIFAPPLLVAAGLAAIRSGVTPSPRGAHARRKEPAPAPTDRGIVPVLAAAGLLFVAAAFADLLRYDPAEADLVTRLARGGGLAGRVLAGPLEALVGVVGATVVLVIVTGALFLTASGIGFDGVARLVQTLRARLAATRERRRAIRTAAAEARAADAAIAAARAADAAKAAAAEAAEVERPAVAVQVPTTPDLAEDPRWADDLDVDDEFTAAGDLAVDEPFDEDAPDPVDDDAMPSSAPAWKLPPMKLLGLSGAQEVDTSAVERNGRLLEAALAEHGVETRLVGMVVGPTVTRYELELGPGVKVARVTSLNKDIAYAMATPDVRILAPIPGRQAIGVEVPNAARQLVTIGDILASDEARRADHPLEVGIGRDINGRSVLVNLAKMPHVLIAGATGAGKSSCINGLITSVLMRSTPDEVRMILIDPKRVELGQYNRLPHLLTQVVTNPKKAANALAWTVREMERRYDLLSEVGVRDITGYNAAYDRGDLSGETSEVLRRALGHVPDADLHFPRLPYVLVVVDELNDLMMVAQRDVEDSICRIAQMARAVGIHLVLATQRPSVNVITGVIKANIPARFAFAVSSLQDSRVILDQGGAERLIGRGDLLMLEGGSSLAQRVQGAWVTEEEVRAVVAFWRRQAPEVTYVPGVEGSDDDQLELFGSGGAASSGEDDDDALFAAARELVVRSQFGSTSMLQRKLRVGFARAGRLMDLLEQHGVVGPSTGSKAREVLMSPEELDALAGSAAPPVS